VLCAPFSLAQTPVATPAAEVPAGQQTSSDNAAPMSPPCAAPSADIAQPTALPNLAEALEKKQPIKVLAIGSSSTVGVGASNPQRNYPNQLSALLKKSFAGLDLQVTNKGVSGEVAAATADRIKSLAALDKPRLVLWQVGTNDALARVPVDSFAETVRSTVRWLKSHEIDVVLVGLQYTPNVVKDEHYHAIREALRKIAEEEQVLHVRRFAAMEFLTRVKGSALLAQDDLHLNDLGYRCMAEHIAHAMVISSFLRVKPRPNFLTP
jgi:lysophospholipase L1-like esterase